jgi:hypothetical protein
MATRESGKTRSGKVETGIAIAAVIFAGAFMCRDCAKEGRMGEPAPQRAAGTFSILKAKSPKHAAGGRNAAMMSSSALIDSLSTMFPRNSLDCDEVPMGKENASLSPATNASRHSEALRNGVNGMAGEINGWAANLISCITEHRGAGDPVVSSACKGVEIMNQFDHEQPSPTSKLLEGIRGDERAASLAAILHYMEYLDPTTNGEESPLTMETYRLRDRYLMALAEGRGYGPDISCVAKRKYLADLSMYAAIELGEMMAKEPFLAERILASVPESQRGRIINIALPNLAFMDSADFSIYSELFPRLSWQDRVVVLDRINQMDAIILESDPVLAAAERLLASNAEPELKDAVRSYASRVKEESAKLRMAEAESDDVVENQPEDDEDIEEEKIE